MPCLSVEETGHSLALRPVAAPRRVGEKSKNRGIGSSSSSSGRKKSNRSSLAAFSLPFHVPLLSLCPLSYSLPSRPAAQVAHPSAAEGGAEAESEGTRQERGHEKQWQPPSSFVALLRASIEGKKEQHSKLRRSNEKSKPPTSKTTNSPARTRAGLGAEEAGEAGLLVEGAGEERHSCDRRESF